MVKKEYSHLVKPLPVREAPAGLYPGPRIWMEGKDLEGFQAHFTYGVFKALVLTGTLLVPPRLFYRIKDWYAAKGLRRLRKVLGEPTSAGAIIQTSIETRT